MIIKHLTILFVSLLMIITVNAQLCQGSLGDPIVNITFGSGNNPGGGLSAATTSYQYVMFDCPQDGFYTVRNNSNACFANSWHTLPSDHTGNAAGYFMLVNASFQPGAFYLDTVRGLCGNTTYEFASWLTNVLLPPSCNAAGIQPNITFSIERTNGTLLQSYNTNNIGATTSPVWKQYGFYFTTPPGGSDIVLRIVNNAPGGCGNDIALDDITFRPCGPQITGSVNGTPTGPVSFCEGVARNYVLSCTVSGGFLATVFQWQYRNPVNPNWTDLTGAVNSTLPVNFSAGTLPGVYEYRLAVAEAGNMNAHQCRIYSQPFVFTIHPKPVTSATNDGPVCAGSAIVLMSTGGSQYAWSGPGSFSGSGSPLTLANISSQQAGKYYVSVTTNAGCTSLDSTTIIVNPSPVATTSFADVSICLGDSIQLLAGGGITYQWTPAGGISDPSVYDPHASPVVTTGYTAIVANQFSCKDTALVLVNVLSEPVANAGPDKIMLQGQPIQLNGSITGQGNYSWSPATYINNIFSLQPFVDPPEDMFYVLNIVSDMGCGASSDTVLVKVYRSIFIPNAFTPNGDGYNDTWNIPALAAYPIFIVSVYSRWGELVFQTRNALLPWDGSFKGKALPAGSYIYFINTGPGQDVFKGNVMIIR